MILTHNIIIMVYISFIHFLNCIFYDFIFKSLMNIHRLGPSNPMYNYVCGEVLLSLKCRQ